MPLFKKILLAYFLIAAALLFKLDLDPRNFLFVAQPAIIALLYWRKQLDIKLQTLQNIAFFGFLMFYGFDLIIQIYDTLKDNDTLVKKSIVLKVLFCLAVGMAFNKEKEVPAEEAD
jgi:amino acid transporter